MHGTRGLATQATCLRRPELVGRYIMSPIYMRCMCSRLQFFSNVLIFKKNIYANVVLIYCLDVLDKQMHPWSLKKPIKDHFPGYVTNLTRFNFVTTHIQTKLTDTKFRLFKKSIFDHFLAMGTLDLAAILYTICCLELIVKQVNDDLGLAIRCYISLFENSAW